MGSEFHWHGEFHWQRAAWSHPFGRLAPDSHRRQRQREHVRAPGGVCRV